MTRQSKIKSQVFFSWGVLALLLATCQTNGASVAVDSKDSYATVTDSGRETSFGDEHPDGRIGLYTQHVEPYGTVGPIGGNKAFVLTSLPSHGGYAPSANNYGGQQHAAYGVTALPYIVTGNHGGNVYGSAYSGELAYSPAAYGVTPTPSYAPGAPSYGTPATSYGVTPAPSYGGSAYGASYAPMYGMGMPYVGPSYVATPAPTYGGVASGVTQAYGNMASSYSEPAYGTTPAPAYTMAASYGGAYAASPATSYGTGALYNSYDANQASTYGMGSFYGGSPYGVNQAPVYGGSAYGVTPAPTYAGYGVTQATAYGVTQGYGNMASYLASPYAVTPAPMYNNMGNYGTPYPVSAYGVASAPTYGNNMGASYGVYSAAQSPVFSYGGNLNMPSGSYVGGSAYGTGGYGSNAGYSGAGSSSGIAPSPHLAYAGNMGSYYGGNYGNAYASSPSYPEAYVSTGYGGYGAYGSGAYGMGSSHGSPLNSGAGYMSNMNYYGNVAAY